MAKRVARVYSASYVNIFKLFKNVNKLKQEMKVLYYSRVNYTALLIICKFNSAIFILLLEFLTIFISREPPNKKTSPYAKPISNYATSFVCPNRAAMKAIYFFA
ncbi:hypothetical protein BCD96_002049 [Clostridium beijerinckii]|uniref:hypothetical protein n=1 Tax=Clostridium beijerinckii TaxID=1520 RepID=UPI00098CC7EB|nr:hypothetical protein [Clostridium beijerinckii]MBA8935169.1 hypothetical protein [Clostridium beijerinckii]NRU39566.1 hypothetical protein [Clostridium beijerinckii]NSA97156.1 hypothetical protein [Clostridium beijerinckii]OOM64453.1 hypothetical protein CLOBI_16830 [Clostridium beijerinckii]OOM70156.1 hypothetical protein CLBEIC_22960 [Clostridium beijerinckii]